MKTIDTLVYDIYCLLALKNHKPSQENVDSLLEAITKAVDGYLNVPIKSGTEEFSLRMSNIGSGDRKLWFDKHYHKAPSTAPIDVSAEGQKEMKFFLGTILEAFLLFFIKESGHIVSGEQEEVSLEGIIGHPDCVIDGCLVDIKTASQFAFDKFANEKLFDEDDFGYLFQIAAYKKAKEFEGRCFFLAFNKNSAELCLLEVPPYRIPDATAKIKSLKASLERDTPPPEMCHPELPAGKSGNMAVGKGCTFCKHKFKCYEGANNGTGLRVFQYAAKKEYLTQVANLPSVPEITERYR